MDMKSYAKGLCLLGSVLALALFLAPLALAGVADDIKTADGLYQQRADLAKAGEAAKLYEQTLQADPKSEEAAWKLARTQYYIGSNSPKDQKEAIFTQAVEAAKKAVAINPKSVPGHFWLGVTYGVYGSAKGIMKSLSLVDPIKEEMAFVIETDPDYEAGGAYRVLGRLYFKLPGLFGGDNDLAIENLDIAVKKGPQRYMNHIYLAEVLIDEDEDKKAKELLELVVAGPAEPGFEPEDKVWKAQAKKILADQ